MADWQSEKKKKISAAVKENKIDKNLQSTRIINSLANIL